MSPKLFPINRMTASLPLSDTLLKNFEFSQEVLVPMNQFGKPLNSRLICKISWLRKTQILGLGRSGLSQLLGYELARVAPCSAEQRVSPEFSIVSRLKKHRGQRKWSKPTQQL